MPPPLMNLSYNCVHGIKKSYLFAQFSKNYFPQYYFDSFRYLCGNHKTYLLVYSKLIIIHISKYLLLVEPIHGSIQKGRNNVF